MKSIVKKSVFACLIIIISSQFSMAQSIGLNYGMAGVENFGAAHSFHITVTSPLRNNFFSKMTLMAWTGEDNNRRHLNDYIYSSGFYGNRAMNFTIYREILQTNNHAIAAGVGIGFYQRVTFAFGYEDKLFEPGLSANLQYRYDLTDRFNIISEGSLHFGDFNFEFDGLVPGGIDWGFLTVGLEYELFR